MHSPALRSAFLLSLLVLPIAQAADPGSDTLQRTFAVRPGEKLVLEVDRGSLTIEGTRTSQMEIVVERKVSRASDAKAAELLAQHQVLFSQDDGVVRVESKLPGKNRWSWGGPQLEVHYRISLPSEFNLDARTAGGAIRLQQVQGQVDLRTSGGSVQLESVSGSVRARTAGGSIRGSRLTGQVELQTSGGSIQVEEAAGDRLLAVTSGGSITLSHIDAPTEARTSGGGIKVECSATPLVASTSGGSIHASCTSVPKAEINLRTSGGGITLDLPDSAAFDLDASTSGGGVTSEFQVPGSDPRHRGALRGSVNGGGPKLSLKTSGGGIRIKRS